MRGRCKDVKANCFRIVTTSLSALAPKNQECEVPRMVPCHAQNLSRQGCGRVMHHEPCLVDCEKKECDAGTVLLIFAKPFFVKRSRHHHCHCLTSQPSTHSITSLGQRSLTRRRGPTSSQEMLGQLWVVVVHIVGTPCFIVLVKFWHHPRALRVVGLLKLCCEFFRCRAPLGSSWQTLRWNACASFGSLSRASSAADSSLFPQRHPELDHQLPPHEISTWSSTFTKSALKTPTTLEKQCKLGQRCVVREVSKRRMQE